MTKSPLFSTYRQGENRVTSSMLAVFERVDLSLVERLLSGAVGESGSIQMISFDNQPAGAGASTPDGRIAASFSYWFEVKTSRHSMRADQLREHLVSLNGRARDERIFIVTPDATRPDLIDDFGDDRVIWFSFQMLSNAIDDALADDRSSVSGQARFLLRELQGLLIEDGLLDSDDVVVVAARLAYPEYLEHGAYVCQPNRSFRDGLTHLGFYAESAIQREIPLILRSIGSVRFTADEAARFRAGDEVDCRVGDLIELLIGRGRRQDGGNYGVFILSSPGDDDTVRLAQPIVNDTITTSGRGFAWTMSQRYVSLTRLARPGVTATSDLEPAAESRRMP